MASSRDSEAESPARGETRNKRLRSSDPPAYKMERVLSVGRARCRSHPVFDRERQFSTLCVELNLTIPCTSSWTRNVVKYYRSFPFHLTLRIFPKERAASVAKRFAIKRSICRAGSTESTCDQ